MLAPKNENQRFEQVEGEGGQNPPDLERLREAHRSRRLALLQKLEQEGSVNERLRERLEREPVITGYRGEGEREWPPATLSLACLFLPPRSEGIATGFPEAANIARFCLRKALQRSSFTPAERKEVMAQLSGDTDSNKDFVRFLATEPGSARGEDERQNAGITVVSAIVIGLSRAGEDRDAALYKQANAFCELLEEESREFFRTPTFASEKGEEGVSSSQHFEPGFGKFQNRLPQEGLIGFLEKQPLVSRHVPCPKATTLRALVESGYDITRVREFTLQAADGEQLTVVSKRLFPRKSASAEQEFDVSRYAWKFGIPTAQPVAELQIGEQRYFLWKKLETTQLRDDEESEYERQKHAIQKQLEDAGIHHLDMDQDRNFIATRNEDGELCVHIIDFERATAPAKEI
ncbi:hypothetical protein MRY87_06985 [bacterium]|nr:hypothetical protein [bacterium]